MSLFFFQVESILDEDKAKYGEIRWLVKWQGYEDLTWELHENLRDNTVFEKYLKDQVTTNNSLSFFFTFQIHNNFLCLMGANQF